MAPSQQPIPQPDASSLMPRTVSDTVRIPTPEVNLPDVPLERIPRHIAVIMDGNGRWAVERDRPRIFGHEQGAKSVRAIVTECAELGVEALTLYSFSLENWKRPADEINFLMSLYVKYLLLERTEMIENNIQFIQAGRRDGLPAAVLAELDATVEATKACTGMKLILALNYGSRAEITDAVRSLAADVQSGKLDPAEITEKMVSERLYVPDIPDPDLLIRTAGQMRISNFLLWQISYAELYVSNEYWPDFDVRELHTAIRDFAQRDRRFGSLADAPESD